MLFTQSFLEGIRSGAITVAFRRWRRPTVRAGGTLLTAVGELSIESVEVIHARDIAASDARRAGYDSREALLAELDSRPEGDIYRIEFGALRADPRIALRQSVAVDPAEIEALRAKLGRLDARAPDGAWTMRALDVIRAHPGVRAGDLCRKVGQEKEIFKINVRKLKALGLTESLEVGYRLSPRGEALLDVWRRSAL
ncbi:MAG: hypothetical protein ABW133_07360 [Polyangiaceae bacterium]